MDIFWPGIKKEISNYISKFMESQIAKVEHKHFVDLLHQLQILDWKWEVVEINFLRVIIIQSGST